MSGRQTVQQTKQPSAQAEATEQIEPPKAARRRVRADGPSVTGTGVEATHRRFNRKPLQSQDASLGGSGRLHALPARRVIKYPGQSQSSASRVVDDGHNKSVLIPRGGERVAAETTQVLSVGDNEAAMGQDRDERGVGSGVAALLDAEFGAYYAIVYRYLLHRFFDREQAEELTAETFYKAATALGRLRADRHGLQTGLLRVATNLANSRSRRLRWRRFLFGRWAAAAGVCTAEAGDPPSVVDQCRERVRAAVRVLPPADQAVIALRYYTQLAYDDIAEILGCRTDAVRARLSRALKRLREQLEDTERMTPR